MTRTREKGEESERTDSTSGPRSWMRRSPSGRTDAKPTNVQLLFDFRDQATPPAATLRPRLRESEAESRVRALAEFLMRHHGLVGWTFEFNRAKRILGFCYLGKRKISLSRVHLQLDSPGEVLNTILHEIAHALCPPSAAHGSIWKETAARIGARPYRLSSRVTIRTKAWRGTCPGCGKEILRHRRVAASCSDCRSSFGRDHLFTWTANDAAGRA